MKKPKIVMKKITNTFLRSICTMSVNVFLAIFLFNKVCEAGTIVSTNNEIKGGFVGYHNYDAPCQYIFSGNIEIGNLKYFQELTPGKVLCLDSSGGSFAEAIRIAKFILGKTPTKIPENSKCLSACALIFMAGSMTVEEDEDIISWRALHPLGVLGFHSPDIILESGNYSEENVRQAFDLSKSVIADAIFGLAMNLDADTSIPYNALKLSLIGEWIRTPAKEMLYVDTLDEVGRWGIGLSGVSFNVDVSKSEPFWSNLCHNIISWSKDRSAETETEKDIFDGYRPTINHAINKNGRVIEIYLNEMLGIGCRITISNSDEYSLKTMKNVSANQRFNVELIDGGSSVTAYGYYFMEAKTKLSDMLSLSELSGNIWVVYSKDVLLKRRVFYNFPNHDIFGADNILTIRSVDISECKVKCQSNMKCTAITFDRWNMVCLLKNITEKSSVLEIQAKADSFIDVTKMSYVKKSTKPVSFVTQKEKGFEDGEYMRIEHTSIDVCKKTCFEDDYCLGFNYISSEWCTFHNTTKAYSDNKNGIIQYKYQH